MRYLEKRRENSIILPVSVGKKNYRVSLIDVSFAIEIKRACSITNRNG